MGVTTVEIGVEVMTAASVAVMTVAAITVATMEVVLVAETMEEDSVVEMMVVDGEEIKLP